MRTAKLVDDHYAIFDQWEALVGTVERCKSEMSEMWAWHPFTGEVVGPVRLHNALKIAMRR